MSVKETESDLLIQALDELAVRRTVTFRGGVRKIKLACGPGFKLVHGICQRQSSTELLARRRAAKRSVTKRRAKSAQTKRKRQLTLRRRHSAGF